jgi:hypothetical protein
MEINIQAEKYDANICKMIDEMNNQPSTSAGQSFPSSSLFQYNPTNVSFVLPEHLRLISRCLLAQKSIFELLKSSTNLRKNPYFVKPQTDEDSHNNDNLFPSMEINLQAEESDADIRKLIDEMNNQPFVLPEHLRLISRCLLAQKAVFEYYKGNSYALNQHNSFQNQIKTQIMPMFFT